MSWNKSIIFSKVLEKIDYSSYGSHMEGAPTIYVWVNLDKATMDEFNNSQIENRDLAIESLRITQNLNEAAKQNNKKESDKWSKKLVDKAVVIKKNNQRIYDWYAKVWSQHEDQSTHITGEKLRQWVKIVNEDEPAFWEWLKMQTQALITLYNNQHLKN